MIIKIPWFCVQNMLDKLPPSRKFFIETTFVRKGRSEIVSREKIVSGNFSKLWMIVTF